MAVYSIANSNRDGNSFALAEYVLPSQHVYGTFYVGYDTPSALDGAWIWVTGIPQGATILTATVLLTRQSTDYSSGFDGSWYGFAVDTPADFVNGHTHRVSDHETRTTANVADNGWANDATHTSPSLVTVVQEIVNRAGFSGTLGLTYRNTTTNPGYFNYSDYTDGAGSAATLTVTWASDPFPLAYRHPIINHPDLRR